MVLDEEYLEQLLNTVEPIVGIEPPKKEEVFDSDTSNDFEAEEDTVIEPEDVEVVTEDEVAEVPRAEVLGTPVVEPIADDLEEAVLSPEEIDAMLNAAQATPAVAVDEVPSEEDLMSMLEASGDDGLEDIGQLLKADEEGEAVDAAALESAITVADVVSKNEDEAAPKKETREEKKARKAALKAEKKAKKEEAKRNKKGEVTPETGDAFAAAAEGKKQGFFSKVLNLLTETDEEEETIEAEGVEKTGLSDENKEILEELDKEGGKKKKVKKPKKDKKKKKAGVENPDAEGDENEEEASGKGKKPRKEK